MAVRVPTDECVDPDCAKTLSPLVVYGLGGAFVVLLLICYLKADVVLGWLEIAVRALFL